MIPRQARRHTIAARVRSHAGSADNAAAGQLTDRAAALDRQTLKDAQPNLRWRTLRMHIASHPVHALSSIIIVVMVVMALAGPWLPLPDPQQQDLVARLQPPMTRGSDGTLHIAGTDQLGRDVLSRLIAGARVTLGVALVTVICATTIGALLGLMAGYRGGFLDHGVMRLVDLQMAFPSLLFAVFLLYLMGANLINLVMLLVLFGWHSFTRITRAQTLSLRNQMFVESALAIGCTHRRILLRHVLPHLIPVLAVIAVFDFSGVMLAEAGLSFLGLGVQPPDTSWGRMISEGQSYIYSGGWWLFLLPGGAIFFAVLSTRLTSAWIQDIVGRTSGG